MNDLRKFILRALPCLCAFLLLVGYVLFPQLNLTAVNLICLFLAFLKLFLGIAGAVNKRKAEDFISSLSISLAALAVNLQGQTPPSLSALSAWELLWVLLAAVSLVCLAAVLLRLIRWSQENWETVRADVQDQRRIRRERRQRWWASFRTYWSIRLESRRADAQIRRRIRRERRRNWWASFHTYRNSRLEARRAFKLQTEEKRLSDKRMVRNIRHEKKWLKNMLELLEWRQALQDLRANSSTTAAPQSRKTRVINRVQVIRPVPGWGWVIIIVVSVAVVCGTAALLIWIPTIQGLTGGVEGWLQAVVTMVAPLMLRGTNQDPSAPQEPPVGLALIYYLMVVILCVTIFVVAIYLIAMLLKRFWTKTPLQSDEDRDNNGFQLLDTYANSFALLLVSFIALYALSSGHVRFDKLTAGWSIVVFTILFILMMLTAFEIVRLVLEQCGQANSVLKRTIFLFFIATLDFLSQVIFGLLKSLHIENAVSSLLMLVLPGNPDEIPTRALEKVKRIFQNEIDGVQVEPGSSRNKSKPVVKCGSGGTGPAGNPACRNRFFRRKVWRKNK
ncbi:MAG: hypothetical protein HFG01_02830 [Oscillibacter sp.]|nr:hypothetical protein [Oscillibacter sp.]